MTGQDEDRVVALHGAWGPKDPPAPKAPAHPYFFGSGLLAEAGGRRTIEYCLLDAFSTIALKFRADWELNWMGPRSRWQPDAPALAGLLMLRMALAGETVVIASRDEEECRLPICAIEDAFEVLCADALYEDDDLRRHAPAAAARMAQAHREALQTEHTAFLVAARLHEVWSMAEAARRAPAEQRSPAQIVPFAPKEDRHPERAPIFGRPFRRRPRPCSEGPAQ